MIRTLLAGICFASLVVAQSPDLERHADTPTKRDVLTEAKQAIAKSPRRGVVTTEHGVVIFQVASDSKVDRDAAAKQARDEFEQGFEVLWKACRDFLPPRAGMQEPFVICDPTQAMPDPEVEVVRSGQRVRVSAWSQSPSAFVRASGRIRFGDAEEVWTLYEKQWFGAVEPALWFRQLAVARIDRERWAKQQKVDGLTKQQFREFQRTKKVELQTYLASIAPAALGPEREFQGAPRVMAGYPGSDAARFLGAFLQHGSADLKGKFNVRWLELPTAYAQGLLAGKKDAEAVTAAVDGIDRDNLQEAMLKWAKARAAK
ncbi:MAG: hypothetical protein ACK501_21540 [Planctomycetota bacterium]|jgi:hypothetical protein